MGERGPAHSTTALYDRRLQRQCRDTHSQPSVGWSSTCEKKHHTAMDSTSLVAHLSNTLSPDNTVRRASETLLLGQHADIVPQILSVLLSGDAEIPPQVKLVGLTLVKNRIAADWSHPATEEKTKETVKNQIVEYIAKLPDPFSGSNHAVVRMCLKIIDIILLYSTSTFQFDLLNFANDLIKKDDRSVDNFFIGVLFVRQVARRNRHLNKYELLDNISLNFCPVYLDFLQTYSKELQQGTTDPHKSLLTHEILKTLNYITTTRVPSFFQDLSANTLQSLSSSLCELFCLLLSKNIDSGNVKWILRFMIKLQIRASSTSQLSYPAGFVDFLQSSIVGNNASTIVDEISKSYELLSNLVDVGDDGIKERTLYYFLVYLTKCISPLTYNAIEPHISMIISNIIVHTLSMTAQETELFEDDPAEFVNSNLSSSLVNPDSQSLPFLDMSNSDIKSASSALVVRLIKNKPEFTSPLISLAGQILSSEDRLSLPCALSILKLVQSHIDEDTMNSAVNRLVEISKSLSKDDMWLCCLIYDFFSELKTKSVDPVRSHLPIFLELSQPLPLLISTLKLMILKSSPENINPVQIMQLLLTLSETQSLEIISDMIDYLVEKYPQQLVPYNSELISNMCSSFMRLSEDENFNTEGSVDDETKVMKLLGLLDNILTVVLSVSDKQVIYDLNSQLNCVISAVLDNAALDLVESVMELVQEIDAKCKQVLNLDTVVNSFKNYGYDYFDYYLNYFQSVYCFGDLKQRSTVTELLKWIISENPSGFDSDDTEFVDFLTSLVSDMVISCNSTENDNGLSDEVFRTVLEMTFRSYDEKDEFWGNKYIFRCIIGGFLKKPIIVMNMFGDMLDQVLLKFKVLIENGTWCTVYDLKLGMLGLLEIVKGCSDNEQIRNMAIEIISMLCDRYNGAVEHREKLLKITAGENVTGSDDTENEEGEEYDLLSDSGFDELHKTSVLDQIDVFGEIKAYLNISN